MTDDLISRSALLEEFKEPGFLMSAIIRLTIENAPAVDAEPVRHGRWIERIEPLSWCEDDVDAFVECSLCGDTMPGETNFCPNCGAKMTEKKARDLRPCEHCEHYEWDMPQCKGCNPENGFKWHKAEVSE